MDGHWPAHADRHALVVLESKNLPKGAHIQPCFAGRLGVFVRVFDAFQRGCGALAEAAKAVIAAIGRLHKHFLAQILHAVAQFALDADVGHFAEAVVISARAVAVERVAVGVGAVYA